MNLPHFQSIGVTCLLALAATAGARTNPDLPPLHTTGQVSWLSGGIGLDEAHAVEAAEARFPLTLEFIEKARPTPEYLAEVPVTIRDQRGHTVLHTVSQGPYLLARLAPGRYTVSAVDHGVVRTDHLTLAAGKPQHRVFEWN